MSEGIITRRASDIRPLLLDRFRNAAAAYSLRPLTLSGQDNPVVKVRRDSDNAEQDFSPAEINDGSLLTFVGNTASDNGFVTTWYDQSGNGNDATQSTAASQPKIVSGGSLVTENGKPAIDFDGSDDSLSKTGSVYGNTDTLFSIIGVSKINTNVDPLIALDYSFPNNGIILRTQDSSTDGILFFDDGSESSISFNFDLSSQNLISLYYDDTTVSIFGNSASVTTGNDSWVNTDSNGLSIGKNPSAPVHGDLLVQEIILYPSDQSSNRTGIESNINNHYGIF